MTPNTHPTPATAELIERLSELAENLLDADPSDYSTEKAWDKYREATDPQTILALCAAAKLGLGAKENAK